LAHGRDNVEDLEKDIYNLIEGLRKEPLISGRTLVDSRLVKTYLRFGLYSPTFYPAIATALDELLDGNATQLANSYNNLAAAGVMLTHADDDSQFSITCTDKKLPTQSFTEMAPIFEALGDESRLLGSHGLIAAMICQHWGVDAKQRYEGNFEATTNHPILIINNRFDPATPIRSAQNVSAGFEGSVVLENAGFGVSYTTLFCIFYLYFLHRYFTNMFFQCTAWSHVPCLSVHHQRCPSILRRWNAATGGHYLRR
jgi:hypothetical protein